MQHCGQGTPMFSRRGKSTSVQYLVFNEEKEQHESSFTQELNNQTGDSKQVEKEELETIFEKINELSGAMNPQLEELKVQKKQMCTSTMNSFFRSVGRDSKYENKWIKQSAGMSAGRYNVSFSIVDKKVPAMQIKHLDNCHVPRRAYIRKP